MSRTIKLAEKMKLSTFTKISSTILLGYLIDRSTSCRVTIVALASSKPNFLKLESGIKLITIIFNGARPVFCNHLTTPLEKTSLIIPKLPAKFRDAIDEYAAELKNLDMKILNLMAKALHMKAEEMNVVFEEGMQSMRMNYYPPCPQPELVTGLCPHSDSVALTILLQVNEIEGLQIKKDGAWIPVVPIPNAFVINIGDILEMVTNGIYRSIEHRATVNSKKERLSIATFFNPNMDGDLGPAPSLVTPETPAKFKTISFADYLKGLFSRELDGKSYLDSMRI
ncbi:2-oxoglutarate (2OG) and Fe(II)-dependent oxygenase superfamily protein [Abeliophyllum distichum]|uniref:2-oxoglutarate (2OG) and Fe(II)-dependent oxygenase superfamily protein n=1 Tax=Abeliophyllum distichum TaxID=126358 RepID=A0ABD1QFU6_9LAMI